MFQTERDEEGKIKQQRITLRKSVRWVIYACLWNLSAQCVFSSGLISVSAKYIKAEIGLMDLEYGCMSSVHSIGKVLGSFFFFSLVNVINRKWIVIFCGIMKALTVIPFALTRNGNILLVLRLISGFPHILPGLYFGSWIANYLPTSDKTAWTRFYSVSSPAGRCLGFYWDLYLGPSKV
ncbi:MAG: MFS transporter [archaeon]|nr:MFS transporter [archaeon]